MPTEPGLRSRQANCGSATMLRYARGMEVSSRSRSALLSSSAATVSGGAAVLFAEQKAVGAVALAVGAIAVAVAIVLLVLAGAAFSAARREDADSGPAGSRGH